MKSGGTRVPAFVVAGALGAIVFLLIAHFVYAAGPITLYVDDDSSCASGCGSQATPYPTIQAAINDANAQIVAATATEATIDVADGYYGERIFIYPDIHVQCANPASVTIDGTGFARSTVVFASGGTGRPTANYSIDGCTITGGSGETRLTQMAGGGVFIVGNAVVSNNVIRDNVVNGPRDNYAGGGIYVETGQSLITGNTIMSNIADPPPLGGQNVSFGVGGGIYVLGPFAGVNTRPHIAGNIIIDNFAGGQIGKGGAIRIDGAVGAEVTRNIMSGNRASHSGGGIEAYEDVLISDNLIYGNTALVFGGGIDTNQSAIQVTNNTIVGNNLTATSTQTAYYYASYGGGINVKALVAQIPPEVNLTNNLIAGNSLHSQGVGAGIASNMSYPNITYSNAWNNTRLPGTTSNIEGDFTELDFLTMTGNLSVDPLFGNAPLFTDVTTGARTTTTIEVLDATRYVTNQLIEYNDDGVLRTITNINTSTGVLTFTPALPASSESGRLITNWDVAASADEDFRLPIGSAGIDAGDNSVAGSLDLDGNARVSDGDNNGSQIIDIGAYELTSTDPDGDGDGSPSSVDCDDADPLNFPGNPEVCDGQDNNCDMAVDENQGQTTCGLGACEVTVDNCIGGVPQSCTPGSPVAETCNLIDDDCNGMADDGLGQTTCGVGGCEVTTDNCIGGVLQTCTPGSPVAETCNSIDDDCNGVDDDGLGQTTCGIGACQVTTDNCIGGVPQSCTPGSPVTETCNLIDDNCDGAIDDGFDLDNDGVSICALPDPDCDDGDSLNFPGNTEVCDGQDNDCDTLIDEGTGGIDTDGDGLDDCIDPDDDNDLVDDALDCAPLVNSVQSIPSGTGNSVRVRSIAPFELGWLRNLQSHAYHLYRSNVGPVTGGSFVPGLSCLVSESPNNPIADLDDPPLGTAYVYVLEGTNRCGNGGVGTDSLGVTRAHPPACLPLGTDTDSDLVTDIDDSCPLVPNAAQQDQDFDNVGTDCDNCPVDANPDQSDQDGNGTGDVCQDLDNDTFTDDVDCDDNNAAINPGATEVRGNTVDENCDGIAEDVDGDGFSQAEGDCNDVDPTINPDAIETGGNTIDENCDGLAEDVDGDGTSVSEGDCDDFDASVFPGQVESCDNVDNNCDTVVDEGFDVDNDNYTTCATPVPDCNDGDAAINPGASEIRGNAIDENCDGEAEDADNDGLSIGEGDCLDTSADVYPGAPQICDGLNNDCDAPGWPALAGTNEGDDDGDGLSECAGDCDDADPLNFPGNPELCDGQDNNCDTQVDEGIGDTDGDGLNDCVDPDDDNDMVDDGLDCAPLVNSVQSPPGPMGNSVRVTGGQLATISWVQTMQANVYNVYSSILGPGPVGDFAPGLSCLVSESALNPVDDGADPPLGAAIVYVLEGTNRCGLGGIGTTSDSSPRINPAFCAPLGLDFDADLVIDLDDNCPITPNPGQEDPDFDNVGTDCDTCPIDSNPDQSDQDGNGTGDVCQDLDGDTFTDDVDCDDNNAAINPGEAEIRGNTVDENCDGVAEDVDGDGYSVAEGDCNDGDPAVNPGASETGGNTIDENCDGLAEDLDGDGVTAANGDCNDLDAGIFPGQNEICDNIDNNCDTVVDEGYDVDGDTYTTCDLPVADCDDGDPDINPGATEIPGNAVDEDCDGTADPGGCTGDPECQDGLFCNGAEVCNAGTCEAGTPPSVDDGVACTIDSCDEAGDTIVNTPDNTPCDNGLFCDGAEICDPVLDCQPATTPCTGQSCDEAGDVCVPLTLDLIDETFDTGAGPFGYQDDTFRGTANPSFADGTYEAAGGQSGGGVRVLVGGNSTNMSGGWAAGFNVGALAQTVTVEVSFRLLFSGGYEPNEFGEALLSVDGTLVGVTPNDYLFQFVGDGATNWDSGWLTESFTLNLSPGAHQIIVGGYNNASTVAGEITEIFFDDVKITENRPAF